jgi:hypothetical protein
MLKKTFFSITAGSLILIPFLCKSENIDFFTDETGLRKGWKIRPWRVSATIEDANKPKAIKMDYTGKKPWGGMAFKPLKDNETIETGKGEASSKSLVFYVNGGNDSLGRHMGGQVFQARVRFLAEDGSQIEKTYQLCANFMQGKTVDNNVETWQRVEIPLKVFVPKSKMNDNLKINGIELQFYGVDLPKSPLMVSNIKISKIKEKKKKEYGAPPTDIEFPEYSQLPQYLKVKPNYKVSILGPNYIVDGKPRFLAGAQISRLADIGIENQTTRGYDKKYNWIYEKIPDFESAQRLGFDTMGYFTPHNWAKKYDPDLKCGPDGTEERMSRFVRDLKMPLYVDYTLFPWGSGRLANSKKIPERAKSDPNLKQHWLPYDMDNEEGLKIVVDYWKYGAEFVVKNKVNALFYELFNEPNYFCECKDNRKKFARWLEKKYGNVNAMNQVWRSSYKSFTDASNFKRKVENQGLYVDFSKFLEERWIEILKVGIKTIKSIDKRKNVQITCQTAGPYAIDPHLSSTNYYKMDKIFGTIQTPTGIGGLGHAVNIGAGKASKKLIDTPVQNIAAIKSSLTMKILRSISPDKPIVNGESGFPPATRQALRDRFWLEMMRGVNATYLFVWTRRAWDIKPANSIEAAITKARQFPYQLLNPFAIPTKALPGIMDFKKEMLAVEDIAAPQPRGIKPEIALLHSYATRRFSYVSANENLADEVFNFYASLEYSNYPFDILLEEQIRDGKKYNDYKIIVAGGIENSLPRVPEKLMEYVKDGGILILGLNSFLKDEYNNPIQLNGLHGAMAKEGQAKPVDLKLSFKQSSLIPGKIKGISRVKIAPDQGASVFASSNGNPLITEKKIGKGKVY